MSKLFNEINVIDHTISDIKTTKSGNEYINFEPQISMILRDVRVYSSIEKRGQHKVLKLSVAISDEQADKIKEIEKHFQCKNTTYTSEKGYNYLYINEWIYSNKIKATILNSKREKQTTDVSTLSINIDDHKKYFNLVVCIPKINISKTDVRYLNVQLQTIVFTDNEYERRDPVDEIPDELIL